MERLPSARTGLRFEPGCPRPHPLWLWCGFPRLPPSTTCRLCRVESDDHGSVLRCPPEVSKGRQVPAQRPRAWRAPDRAGLWRVGAGRAARGPGALKHSWPWGGGPTAGASEAENAPARRRKTGDDSLKKRYCRCGPSPGLSQSCAGQRCFRV